VKKPTRRRFIQSVATTASAAVASSALAATTTTTSQPKLPPEEIAAALRLLGHDFTDAEQKLMVEGLQSRRELYLSIRDRKIDPRTEPAVQFNPRLPGVEYPTTGPSSFTLSDASTPDYNGDPTSLAFAKAADLSRLIHAKKITSVELTKMYLQRLDTIGRRLNAVITLTSDLALAQAKRADEELAAGKSRGPLHGIPYGAKDLLATKNIPTTLGVKILENQTTDYDATVITKLEQAGAVLLAKLSLGELCMGDVWFGGRTRSPWNEKEGSSGSSAGPCAATAAGCVAFAIGSETMGSIISPCLVNKTTGLRPTYDRISRVGAFPLARTMDKLGPITRSVEDASMVLHATHDNACAFTWNPAADVKQLKVGYDKAAFDKLKDDKSKAKRDALNKALDTIKELVGADLKPITLPRAEEYSSIASLIIAAESASSFTDMLRTGDVRKLVQQDAGSWPNTFRKGATIPAADYLRANQLRTQLMQAMHESMQGVDLYMTIPYSGPTIAFTNMTGHPSLVTRAAKLGDSFLLLEFLGQPYREDAILRLAFEFEKTIGLNNQWPAI